MPSLRPSLTKAESAAARLRRDLLGGLAGRRLAEGDRILSERTLAAQLSVSYMTVRRALHQLVAEGLLERRPRIGIFVARGARAEAGLLSQTRRVRGLFYLETMTQMYAQLHAAVARTLDQAGIEIVWSTVSEVVRPDMLDRVQGWLEDAFVVVGAIPPATLRALTGSGRPVLVVDVDYEGCDADNVVLDNEGATADAASRFFDAGHTRVAYVGSLIPREHPYYDPPRASEWPNSLRRAMGVRRAYLSRGLTVDETLFHRVDYLKGARALAAEWFAKPGWPSAVVCFDCVIAAGLLQVAKERGLRIPQELAVTGIGTPPEEWVAGLPSLAHYAFDWEALGREAAALCITRLRHWPQPGDGDKVSVPRKRIALPWRFVPGASAGWE